MRAACLRDRKQFWNSSNVALHNKGILLFLSHYHATTTECTEIHEAGLLYQAMANFVEWRELGTVLGISDDEMDEIEEDKQTTKERRRALLRRWFDGHTKVCWEELTDSLRVIGKHRKAKEIADKYIVTTKY